ncbi:hypothetical protein LguiB_013221 [Lonicera macranthoides]
MVDKSVTVVMRSTRGRFLSLQHCRLGQRIRGKQGYCCKPLRRATISHNHPHLHLSRITNAPQSHSFHQRTTISQVSGRLSELKIAIDAGLLHRDNLLKTISE